MKSIEQEVKDNLSGHQLPDRLAERIKRKITYLKRVYGIDYNTIVYSLVNEPNLYNQRHEIEDISTFFNRSIDIFIKKMGENDTIYSKVHNKWLTTARYNSKLAINHPSTSKVESWSRISSISESRTLHHSTSTHKDKSKFLGCFPYIQPRESLAINNGIGLMHKDTSIRFYAKFDDDIGKSPRGKLQRYICVECERINRSVDTNQTNKKKAYGYKLRVHGYPVSSSDLQKDFKNTPLKIENVPELTSPP